MDLKKRPVVNHVTAHFKFVEGTMIEHHDTFDIYTWSRQALVLPRYVLGWSGFMQSNIQSKTNNLLSKYIEGQN